MVLVDTLSDTEAERMLERLSNGDSPFTLHDYLGITEEEFDYLIGKG